MTKNWIYCRVSSEKQSDYLNGHTSLEVQQNTVYEFAEKYGVNIEHCYYDICSARNMAKQYYLNELLKIVSQGDSIYFYDVSRFSRNTKDALNCLDNLASRNITVNCIAPGFIKTPMTENLNEDQKNNLMQKIPIQRFGVPEDIAATAVYLSSNEASYITGSTIHVNGGLAMF